MPRTWTNNGGIPISAPNLNDLEAELKTAKDAATLAASTVVGLDGRMATIEGAAPGNAFPVWSGIKRMYLTSNTPPDGKKPGDLILRITNPPAGPAGIGGTVGWWDMSAYVGTDTNEIFVVKDISGFGRDLSSTLGTRPVYRSTGGKPRANLGTDTSSRFMNMTGSTTTASGSYVVYVAAAGVAKPSGASAMVASSSSITDSTLLYNAAWGQQGPDNTYYESPASTLDGSIKVFIMEYNAATGNSVLTINGQVKAQGPIASTAKITNFIVGARSTTGTNPMWGSFNEAAIINRAITPAEKQALIDYSQKWLV